MLSQESCEKKLISSCEALIRCGHGNLQSDENGAMCSKGFSVFCAPTKESVLQA